ncbi:pyruvoyl-dependent arginine decarboxylase [Candidatus Bathyarchaeota archaeon]|nr:MAG: pyruvoyl-dependent arginine decarboxylase [Candidatus Bathyarchaeota archaeon]
MRRTRLGPLLPREYFLTSGRGTSSVSPMNAFDNALMAAGIANCNLLPVSSIIPSKCRERRWKRLEVGTIAPVIMAKAIGRSGETIGAGLAWGWEKEHRIGLVAEVYGHYDRKALQLALDTRIKEMADARHIELADVKRRIEVMKVPQGMYGCVLVALVFIL